MLKLRLISTQNGRLLLDLLKELNIGIRSDCGGVGVCGKCLVRVLSGSVSKPTLNELKFLKTQSLTEGFRLACQTLVFGEVHVEIPESSLIRSYRSVDEGLERLVILSPSTIKQYVEVPPPNLNDQKPDLERVLSVTQRSADINVVPLNILKELPKLVRNCSWKVTITLRGNELLDIECGDTVNNLYGAAVDIGTSKIVIHLVNLHTGETVAITSSPNPQQVFGADVISRIANILRRPEVLNNLHESLVSTVNELLLKACLKAGVEVKHVYEMVVVGNTVMTHLFLGVDPSNLGLSPYIPVFAKGLNFRARDLNVSMNPNGYVYLAPGIAGFVGADAVADAVAVDFLRCSKPCVLVDIGTNTEVLVNNGSKIYAASAPAGPAFEGFGTKYGMRAVEGAISKVFIYLSEHTKDYEVVYEVIGGGTPKGVCGSAYIDVLAHLYRYGVIDRRGRFKDFKSKRLIRDGDVGFVLAWSNETSIGEDIVVYSKDVETLILAKAAVASVIEITLKKAGLKHEDIDKVFIAGSFGVSLNVENAATIGLIPTAWVDKTVFVGNTAVSGAKLMLKSVKVRDEAEEIVRKTKYVEVSRDEEFSKTYVKNLFLP